MDPVRLINEGRRGLVECLDTKADGWVSDPSAGVERAWYDFDGASVPVIEKWALPDAYPHTLDDASRLAYWGAKGLRVPDFAISSCDPRVTRRNEREGEVLYLADLTEGGRYGLIDLNGQPDPLPASYRIGDAATHLDTLRNKDAVREELARSLAMLAHENVEPRMDHFMVKVREGEGLLYFVDVDFYRPRFMADEALLEDCLRQVGITQPYAIVDRFRQHLQEMQR